MERERLQRDLQESQRLEAELTTALAELQAVAAERAQKLRAAQEEFYICESCPDEVVEKFLFQARNWRPVAIGKNTLRNDDCADVVSYATDPSLEEYIPSSQMIQDELEEEAEYEQEEPRSRYCAL